MGDGADMALDAMMDYDKMYINGDFDDSTEDGPFYPAFSSYHRRVVKSTTKTCRNCGQTDLIWHQLDSGKWRLSTKDGKIHNCLTK